MKIVIVMLHCKFTRYKQSFNPVILTMLKDQRASNILKVKY